MDSLRGTDSCSAIEITFCVITAYIQHVEDCVLNFLKKYQVYSFFKRKRLLLNVSVVTKNQKPSENYQPSSCLKSLRDSIYLFRFRANIIEILSGKIGWKIIGLHNTILLSAFQIRQMIGHQKIIILDYDIVQIQRSELQNSINIDLIHTTIRMYHENQTIKIGIEAFK